MTSMEHSVVLANVVLRFVGLGIVEKCIGFWYVNAEGRLARRSRRYGWRLTTASEARQARPGDTAFDWFIRRNGGP